MNKRKKLTMQSQSSTNETEVDWSSWKGLVLAGTSQRVPDLRFSVWGSDPGLFIWHQIRLERCQHLAMLGQKPEVRVHRSGHRRGGRVGRLLSQMRGKFVSAEVQGECSCKTQNWGPRAIIWQAQVLFSSQGAEPSTWWDLGFSLKKQAVSDP